MRLRPNTLICLLFFISVALLYAGFQLWQTRATQPFVLAAETEWMDVNQASFRELATLPGIGPELARRIVALRDTRQGFTQVNELLDVRGIGKKKLNRIRLKLKIIPLPSKK